MGTPVRGHPGVNRAQGIHQDNCDESGHRIMRDRAESAEQRGKV